MTAAATETTSDQNASFELDSSSPASDYGTATREVPEPRNNNASDDSSSKEFLVWRKPWIAAAVLFSFFYLFWFQRVIIQRYWADEDFGKALPGLDKTALRKFTIRLHMTCGGIAILCSPIQMVTPFTVAWKKRGINWYRRIHRVSGRIYVVCALLSFLFGQWFICLKKFALVGGYNMGVAFSFAGFAIAYFAYMTWKTAPTKNRDGRYTIEDHRNYAIRSFSQIIAPILYRYWYILVMIFTPYQTPPMYLSGGKSEDGRKLVCDDRDVCGDYERPFDAFYSWFYWMSAWAVAEVIIVCLPKHQKSAPTPAASRDQLAAPLLTTEPTEDVATSDSSRGDSNAGSDSEGSALSSAKTKRRVVDFVGCLLAALTVLVTSPILYSVIKKIATKTTAPTRS